MPVSINLDTWNELPADVQEVMVQVGNETVAQARNLLEAEEIEAREALHRLTEVVNLEPAEQAKMDAVRDATWQSWADAREAEGLPGQAVLDDFLVILQKHGG